MVSRRLLLFLPILLIAAMPHALRQPTGAMEPTLLVGDNFLVDQIGEPKVGLVVVMAIAFGPFNQVFPASQRPDLKRDFFVKRIVALGGSTVAIQKGTLVVDGKSIPAQDTGKDYMDTNGRALRVLRQVLGTHEFEILDSPQTPLDVQEFMVPPEHVFVMGDNRDFSKDSRHFGPFPLADVIGRVGRIYASLNPVTGEVRRERAGTKIN